MNTKKKAIMVTGAAARISQEVALIDKLISEKGLTINATNTLLAGFSSGSLNLLALNLCFRSDNPLSWEKDYKQNLLWKLTNEQVYTKREFGIPIFNTDPLRKTLDSFLNLGNVAWFGDLDFESFVLTFSDRHLKTEWAKNFQSINQKNLKAADLFMASCAIPIVFPSQKITSKTDENRNFPEGHFSDGGTGGQFSRFDENLGRFVLENGALEVLHIISPMRQDGKTELEQLKNGLHGQSFLHLAEEEMGKISANLSFDSFLKFLESIQKWQIKNGSLADEIFISIPDLNSNFEILDFDKEEEQYNAVSAWVDTNKSDFAVPINDFVAKYKVA